VRLYHKYKKQRARGIPQVRVLVEVLGSIPNTAKKKKKKKNKIISQAADLYYARPWSAVM
jgi:hypothetical protein